MSNPISPELQIYSPEVFETPNGEMLAVRFEVESLLEAKIGPDWQEIGCEIVLGTGLYGVKTGDHHTVREPEGKFGLIMLGGDEFAEKVPGIWDLYQGTFKQMMQAALPAGLEPLHTYNYPPYDNPQVLAIEPVAQPPADPNTDAQNRYEAHVDQRYTGVLVLDAPESEKQGGRLVISNNPDTGVKDIDAIKADATYITHKPGTLLCFSTGRFYPHYTEEVTDSSARRVTVSLNYPVEGETPEAAQELLDHNLKV